MVATEGRMASRLISIVPAGLVLLSTILFGTMKGERDGLFSPILGLLITSLLILALTGGLCVFLPEAKQEWPILLASTNSLAGLFLFIAWVVFIAAMAQGGPVKIHREQREECLQLITECSDRAETRSLNHHCNAAMAFVTISVLAVGFALFTQWREASSDGEEKERDDYLAPQKRELDSPRPSPMI
ncbi:Oidioi.mRNA.OKI2018_I69.XSR.g14722.t1.cds [Oikopleura dioica]|uniref:Oidioi.mRNA.OKI2018_I69.XSR.g14722.t1.cds n=1 Tax=Oikopleura dioica TaxID=34765 RepID=A0ABN7SAM3_OIKDI|nr:Oidioi.mRNA.OKI2018_I69.XSR.g14722.t1.cds [Oikopleura dioica]